MTDPAAGPGAGFGSGPSLGTGAGTSPSTSPSTSAGALLRAARERQGLHIAALAAAIKVTPRKLDALENDRWSELPDATFTRALALTVCRTLKVDAQPVLALLPASGAGLESAGPGLNAPFRERPGRSEPGIASAAIRPMLWAAGLLMVAAVVVYFVPDRFWSLRFGSTPAALSAASTPVAMVVLPAASAPLLADVGPAADAATAPAAGTTQTVVETGSSPAPAPAPAPAATAPAATAPAASAAPPGALQLRTTQASWVDVRDARGQVLLSRTVLPGEAVGLDGNPPIRVTIGNAAATQLGFRGHPVDLAARTRDNVARVELQ